MRLHAFAFLYFALYWNSDSKNSFVTCTYICDFCWHSLKINFSLVMSSLGVQEWCMGKHYPKNAMHHDDSCFFNFWHKNKNSAKGCVQHSLEIPRKMAYLKLLTLYVLLSFLISL